MSTFNTIIIVYLCISIPGMICFLLCCMAGRRADDIDRETGFRLPDDAPEGARLDDEDLRATAA